MKFKSIFFAGALLVASFSLSATPASAALRLDPSLVGSADSLSHVEKTWYRGHRYHYYHRWHRWHGYHYYHRPYYHRWHRWHRRYWW